MHYEVNIYNEFGTDLQSIWQRFEKECDHYVFQSYDWLAHWYQTIGINYHSLKPCITIVTDNSMLVALFPFGIRKCLGARVLEFLGGDQSDYNSPLIYPEYSNPHLSNSIWESVNNQLPTHDIQLFNKLPARLNQSENSIFHFWQCRLVNDAYAATLPESWELYKQCISKKMRNDSKRQLRRLAENGTVQFLIAATDEEYDRFVTAMFEQKRRRFQETGARDVLSDAATQAFYRSLRGAIGDKGSVHLSALILNDNILATHWGITYGDRFYFLIPTFAGGEWEKFSVGRLLQERIMEWAIYNGLKIFDFTIGGEQYKKIWSDREMHIYNKQNLITLMGIPCMLYIAIITWIRTTPRIRAFIMSIISRMRKLH